MRPRIDLTDFIVNGRFGPFDRDTDAGTVIAALGPSDSWVTYPGMLAYGNVGFEVVDAPDATCRLLVQFAFQHPERFRLPYESWRANAEPARQKLLFDWPDSRFDFALGPFRSGATLDSLYDDFFSDVEEADLVFLHVDGKLCIT